MILIFGGVALAAALGLTIFRLAGRDRYLIGIAIAIGLLGFAVLARKDRATSARHEQLQKACQFLANKLRHEVEEFDKAIVESDQVSQASLFALRNSFMRSSTERLFMIEQCVKTTRDCFPGTLGNDTRSRVLAAADSLERRRTCGN